MDCRADKDLQSLLASRVLLQLTNVIVTSHNAYITEDAARRILTISLDNIEGFARGAAQNAVR